MQLSQRVAALSRTPRDLATALAHDEDIAVAGPMLERCDVLTDEDLRAIGTARGTGHLLAMTRRSSLSEAVTDMLIESGDRHVLAGVTRNAGARFSAAGLRELAFKATKFDEVGAGLFDRDDIDFERLDRLVASLEHGAGERLRAFIRANRAAATELALSAHEKVARSREKHHQDRLEALRLATAVREGRHRLDQCLDALIMGQRLVDIATLLADVAGLPEAHVSNVLHEVNDFGTALVRRSAGVGQSTYLKLSRLRCERLHLPHAEAEKMATEYRTVDRVTAERALRFHRIRADVMGV
ncbi:MAG: DUF2336 domain-containing protein [Siculibacillus sp.]|nr:DUF2336 domain-containing protein [Siculibacillus sp.]